MASKSNNKNKTRRQRRQRRHFTPEFRADVVRLCQSGSESITAVCERLDLTGSAVRQWVAKAEATVAVSSASPAVTPSEREELHRLRHHGSHLILVRYVTEVFVGFGELGMAQCCCVGA